MWCRRDSDRGIFTEAVVAGNSSPAHYGTVELERFKTSSPKYNWNQSKVVRIKPLKKTPADQPETSPSIYKHEESFKKRIATRMPCYSTPREKGKSFIQRYQAQKAHIPSPSFYHIEKADKIVTIGARRGYK